MAPENITHGAIVGLKSYRLLAHYPDTFVPSAAVRKSLVKCLRDGDTSDLAEAGVIDLGDGLPKYTPGKVDPGEAIYGTAGQEGGCVVFKTKTTVLLGVYTGQPTTAVRFCEEMADYLEEQGDRWFTVETSCME